MNKGLDGMMDMMIWSFLQPGPHQKPDIENLKENVQLLCRMAMQKTAGQRKNKPGDVSFDELERIKWNIIMESVRLVLSGKLDEVKNENSNIGECTSTPCSDDTREEN